MRLRGAGDFQTLCINPASMDFIYLLLFYFLNFNLSFSMTFTDYIYKTTGKVSDEDIEKPIEEAMIRLDNIDAESIEVQTNVQQGQAEQAESKRQRDDRDRPSRVTETFKIENEDAAFVLGRNGSTKKKIARVCGADLDLNESDVCSITLL